MLTVSLTLAGWSGSSKPSSLVTFPVFISASSKIGKETVGYNWNTGSFIQK